MNQTRLPILDTGSQPGETDGAEPDYMHMPSQMSTYSAPPVPEADEVRDREQGMVVLQQLLSQLRRHDGTLSPPITLKHLDEANCELVNQVLGEGEVSIVIDATPKIRIQESVLAGVWRVQRVDEFATVLDDDIEVAKIPRIVRERSFVAAQTTIAFNETARPDGVINAPALLTEINDRIPRVSQSGGCHAINLSLLPQTDEDLALLVERLGRGSVAMLSRGYGNCRITSTRTQHVWWVQYFNSQDAMILNTLEITAVPEVACAAHEDITDSAQRLSQIVACISSP